ncbi:MAG TPA: site-specific integrase [Acidimicrobiales bacterium]|nr:site-specific integrase [Acidimicrobiales bacterium]
MAGTMRERSPGRWELRAYAGRDPLTGKPRQVTRTYVADRREKGAGKRQAERELARLVAEVEQGQHGGSKATLGQLLDDWTAHGERMGRSPKTLYEYRRKVDRQIRPALGAKPLDKLTAHDLDLFYANQLAAGLSDRSVLHLHRILTAALRQGRKWGWVTRSVAEDATPPKPVQAHLNPPPPDRVSALVGEAGRPAARNPELATVITLAALTGMRRGELCGLQWGDVDWQASTVTVRRAIWQAGGTVGVKPPKTHQVRELRLGAHAMGVLAGRAERATVDATMAGITLRPTAFVFSPEVDGSRPMRPDSVTQAFDRLCRRMEDAEVAKLRKRDPLATLDDLPSSARWPYRFHDLRHYTATELIAGGMDPRTVADRLGHADPSITLRVYAAGTPARAQAAADILEAGLLAVGPAD